MLVFAILMDTTNNPPSPDANGAPPPAPLPPVVDQPVKADHTNAVLCHLLSLCGYVGIPFGNVLGPLIWWLFKKDSDPEVDLHGKESLNFQISVTIYLIAAGLLVFLFIEITLRHRAW